MLYFRFPIYSFLFALQIFDSLEAIPNAPKKAIDEFLSWARGEQDPDWNRKKK